VIKFVFMFCFLLFLSAVFLVLIPLFVYGQEVCSEQHYEGISTNVEVSCAFNRNLGPTLWIINGSVYDLRKESIPFLAVDGIYAIDIPEIYLCVNDTTFQCLSSTRNPPGRTVRLCVTQCKFIFVFYCIIFPQ